MTATGNYVVIRITSATSIVLNSGSSLGAASGTPFRIWVEGFNDGGTFRLAVSNQSVSTQIYPLNEAASLSATQCNACSNATSAGVFYAPAPVTSQAMRVLGYMEWGSGLPTAGMWATGPTLIQLFGPGIKKPGEVVQTVQMSTTTNFATTSGAYQTTSIVQAITPSSPANQVKVTCYGSAFASGSADALIAIFRGATQLGAVGGQFRGNANALSWVNLVWHDSPSSTGSVTYAAKLKNAQNDGTNVFFPFAVSGASIGYMLLEEIMG